MYSLLRRGVLVPVLTGMVCFGAERFNLEVQNLTVDEARSSPAGYGGFGQFMTAKPATIKKVPDFGSKHPLYGQVYGGTDGSPNAMVFVLDESKGAGEGYDLLRVDLNLNGDLTDDGAYRRHEDGATGMPPGYQQSMFGPVEVPEAQKVGPWRPRFYAQCYLYNMASLAQAGPEANYPIGQLRMLPANWLVTTADVNGVQQKFGLADGNCNFRMPDGAQTAEVYRSASAGPSWYLSAGDYFLRDFDGDGKFQSRIEQRDAEMYSSVVYFGKQPYLAKVDPGLAWVEFEPYPKPTGRLKVGAAVSDLVLGWQGTGAKSYEALTPVIVEGEAIVPAGDFRGVSCVVSGKTADGARVVAQSSEVPADSVSVAADGISVLKLGLPLEIVAEATQRSGVDGEEAGFKAAVSRMFGGSRSQSKFKDLVINATIRGAGGERYSSFVEAGGAGSLPTPKFEVRDSQGKVVASGNLEFG